MSTTASLGAFDKLVFNIATVGMADGQCFRHSHIDLRRIASFATSKSLVVDFTVSIAKYQTCDLVPIPLQLVEKSNALNHSSMSIRLTHRTPSPERYIWSKARLFGWLISGYAV